MIRQDFLLVLIEEMGKKLARLIKKKETGDLDIVTFTNDCYRDLKLSFEQVSQSTADDLIEHLQQWGTIELLVKLIVQDDRMKSELSQIEKAAALLFYVQEQDRTFSLERIELQKQIDYLLK